MSDTAMEHREYAWVRHLLPRIVIGALIAAALVGVYAVAIGEWDALCWRLIGTICLFVFFALASWYDADVSARRAPWFGAVSVVTSVYLLIAGLVKVWTPTVYDPTTPWWEPFAWFALVVVARLGLLHIHLVLNTQRRFTGPIMSKVTVATLVLVGLLMVGLSLPLLLTRAEFSDTYWRLVAVIAILDALGTILIPLTFSLFGPKKQASGAPQAPPTLAPAWQPAPPAATATASAPVPPAFPFVTPGAAATGSALPAAVAYPRLNPSGGLLLEWPRYVNGAPLPANADGTPDFTGVAGFGS